MTPPNTQSDLQTLQATIAKLEKQNSEQHKIIGNQQQKLTEYQAELNKQHSTLKDRESLLFNKEAQIHKLVEQLSQLQNAHFGSSSERYVPTVDPRQMKMDFFNEAELLAALNDAMDRKETNVKPHKRKGRKSKPLPEHLPVVEVEHEPDHTACQDCGKTMKCIGKETVDQLGVVPQVYYIIRHIRPKMGCPGKCGVKTASMPEQPLPGTQASPVLLAYLMVAKYLDGLPLFRLEGIAKRFGVDLPRNKTARWIVDIGLKLSVLVELLVETYNEYDIGCADETRIQVLKEPKRAPQLKSWFWILRGGPPDKPVAILHYSSSRSSEVANELLGGFEGYLVCDAYSGYLPLSKTGKVILVYCNDHSRRRFRHIVKSVGKDHAADTTIAARALLWYQCLYDIEDEIKEKSVEEKYLIRQNKAVPLWDSFIGWASQIQTGGVLHQPTRQALQYLLNHQVELRRYCEDGRLPISNIGSEHVAKKVAVSRKAYLFSDTVDGAKSSANNYSLIETARANGHEPFRYLTVILTELPKAKERSDFERLLPWNITPEQVDEQFNSYPAP